MASASKCSITTAASSKCAHATGAMGWVEQRYLVGQEVYDQIQKLTADNQNDPVQAQGTTRNDTNLHVEPGRDSGTSLSDFVRRKIGVAEAKHSRKAGIGGRASTFGKAIWQQFWQ